MGRTVLSDEEGMFFKLISAGLFSGFRGDLCAFADWNRIIVGTLQDKNDVDEEDSLSSRRDSDDMVQEWR